MIICIAIKLKKESPNIRNKIHGLSTRVLHDGGRCLYADYSDPIDVLNDWFRDESFTIVRHCPLTKCA